MTIEFSDKVKGGQKVVNKAPVELVLEEIASLKKSMTDNTRQIKLSIDNMCEHIISAIEKNMEGNLARSIAINSGKPTRAVSKPKKDKPKTSLPWESIEPGTCSGCKQEFKKWTSIEKHHLGSKKAPKGCCPVTRKPAKAVKL